MTKATKRLRRSGVAGLAALATVGGVLVTTAGSAGATSTATVNRIGGTDRYDTAAQLAEKAFPSGATNVIIASGAAAHFPDALAGNYLAGIKNAPILLTSSTGAMPTATTNALSTLKPTNVYILGDTNAVPAAQATALTAAGYNVTRYGGATRYDTDLQILNAGGTVGTVSGLKTAIVASGANFPDALSAGPAAYHLNLPVILTDPATLSTQAKTAITSLGIQQVLIMGSTAAVSAADETSINTAGAKTLQRFAGTDRSNTSQLFANWELSNGFSNASAVVASGDQTLSGADALAGGPYAGSNAFPVLVTNTITNGGSVAAFLAANSATESSVTVLGKAASVADAVVTALTTAVQSAPSTQTYTVSPAAASTQTVSTVTGGVSDNKGNVQYTASGLGTTAVDIKLVKPSDITTTNGKATFLSATTAGQADLNTATQGSITVVNGAPQPAATTAVNNVTPVNGQVTFTLDSTAAGSAVPVVFSNADSDNVLNLNSTTTGATVFGTPTEAFGVGGAVTWVPAEASLGPITAGTPTTVSVAGKYFVLGGATYYWDSNDVFQYKGIGITQAQFESMISTGSTVGGTFSPTTSDVSTFNISAQTETGTSAATAAVKNLDNGAVANDVQVTATPAATDPSGTTYQLLGKSSTATSYTTVPGATMVTNSDGSITFTVKNVAAGTYTYEVQSTYPVTGTKVPSTASIAVTIGSATTAPKSTYAAQTTVGGLAGTLDAGDVLTFAFDSTLNAVAAGNTVQLKDADGTIVNLVNGTNATFALNAASTTVNGVTQAANTVLTVTVTATPSGAQVVQAGTTAGLQYPATVTDESGISNGAGWNISGSSDITVS